METKALLDSANTGTWNELLSEFHKLIANKGKREDYDALKKKAEHNANLTIRQSEGIVARCNNVLSLEYGNSKDNFEIGGKPSHKKEAEKK